MRTEGRIVCIAGGTGAAKWLRGLVRVVEADRVTVIVNTGDDARIWGLHVSPDLDTVMYTLAGMADEAKGWGIAGDTFETRDAMARLGGETWFNLGNRDLATHLFRTERLARGETLSEVTDRMRRALGVATLILPMSDDRIETRVRVPDGWVSFQEYFVRRRAADRVLDVAYQGASDARPAPGVLEAVAGASVVVVCPSNPVTSVGPVLAVPGIRDGLRATGAPVVAISPIVGGDAVSGPAGRLMAMRGWPVSPVGVARAYASWLDVLVMDERDAVLVPAVEREGVRAVVTHTLMHSREDAARLADAVLDAAAPPAEAGGRG